MGTLKLLKAIDREIGGLYRSKGCTAVLAHGSKHDRLDVTMPDGTSYSQTISTSSRSDETSQLNFHRQAATRALKAAGLMKGTK